MTLDLSLMVETETAMIEVKNDQTPVVAGDQTFTAGSTRVCVYQKMCAAT